MKTKTKETAAPKETSVGRKLFRDSCDIPLSLNKYTDILKKNSNKPVRQQLKKHAHASKQSLCKRQGNCPKILLQGRCFRSKIISNLEQYVLPIRALFLRGWILIEAEIKKHYLLLSFHQNKTSFSSCKKWKSYKF